MEFTVARMTSRPDTALVRYDCECGCKPNAKYQQGSAEVGHEHCCCGRVHFVGPHARAELEAYLAARKTTGEDEDRGAYTITDVTVAAPWGGAIPVAYGIPEHPSH